MDRNYTCKYKLSIICSYRMNKRLSHNRVDPDLPPDTYVHEHFIET